MKCEPSLTRRLLRGGIALLLILQFTLLQAMVVNADLHHECHHDSHEPHHHCEVTMWLQSGGCELSAPVALPVAEVTVLAEPPVLSSVEEIHVTPPQFIGGISAHGPPRAP